MLNGFLAPRDVLFFWSDESGMSNSAAQNAMIRRCFLQIRQYLHFVDNHKMHPRGHHRHHPLQKIQPVLDYIQVVLRRAWNLGPNATIDESMIKYMGMYVTFVQYMPKKPIKHGIKVFALCDAATGYLYAFEIYTGRNAEEDGSAMAIVQRLLRAAGVSGKGRTVFMDNWYTGMPLFKAIHDEFDMMCVGTVTGTKKLSRTAADFPFHKMSPQALARLDRGFSRSAYKNVHKRRADGSDGGVQFTLEATTWKDKKQVFILSNHKIDVPSDDNFVQRLSPRSKRKKDVPSPKIISEYNTYYNGVDQMDRGTADWSVSLKAHRWYMRVFYWAFDTSIHSMYQIVTELGKNRNDPWFKYQGRDGHARFCRDMGHALIERGFTMDSPDVNNLKLKQYRPKYARSIDWPVPCKDRVCFFCKKGYTCGVDHARFKVRMNDPPLRPGPFPIGDHPTQPVSVKQSWCVMCLDEYNKKCDRLGRPQPSLTWIRSNPDKCKIARPRQGCNLCPNKRGRGVAVCERHWSTYVHKP